jgi:hypothetical protein
VPDESGCNWSGVILTGQADPELLEIAQGVHAWARERYNLVS